jgi:hypothetical protein
MPLNLSALIRYKTLNNCFSSIRKYTIDELVERCSEALSEYKGEPTSISERTIREDIKHMRSDLLGFNAPIEQKEGYYFYSDRDYDLLNVFIRDEVLAFEILNLLMDIKENIDHPKLEKVLTELRKLISLKRRMENTSEATHYTRSLPEQIDLLPKQSMKKRKSRKLPAKGKLDQKIVKKKEKVSTDKDFEKLMESINLYLDREFEQGNVMMGDVLDLLSRP